MTSSRITKNKSFFQLFSLDRSDLIAGFICICMFFFWLNLLREKFLDFGYYDWDLAMYAQATWALSQGSFYSSIFGTNFLTNHAEYIAFFIAPFYKLFPSAFTLIVLKILSFVTGSFVFYLITKKSLGWRLGILFMLLYQSHPANAFMMIYEFHYENLAIVFIFLMYYFFINQRLVPFLICAFFATLVKENISLIVFMFGLYALIKGEPKGKGWVIGPFILGLGVFILTMFIITPYLRVHERIPEANSYLSLYLTSSNKTPNLIDNIWQNISALGHTFISPINRQYMIDLILPFHILPLLNPLTLLLGIPIFLQHFLSQSNNNHVFYFHYAATAIIFIFLATVTSLAKIKKHLNTLLYCLLIILTVAGYCLSLGKFWPEFENRISQWQIKPIPTHKSMIDQIPPNASLVTSFDFLSRLTQRHQIFSFQNVWENYSTFTKKTPFVLPKDLSYALIDWMCPWLWFDLLYPPTDNLFKNYLDNIHKFYFSRSWSTVAAIEEITIFSKTKTSQPPLVENSKTPFQKTNSNFPSLEVNNSIRLVDLEVYTKKLVLQHSVLPFVFTWQSKESTSNFLGIVITLIKENTIIDQRLHPIGYAFNATPLWTKGQYIKENYNFLLSPSIKPGNYTLQIEIIDLKTGRLEPLIINEQKSNHFTLPILI